MKLHDRSFCCAACGITIDQYSVLTGATSNCPTSSSDTGIAIVSTWPGNCEASASL